MDHTALYDFFRRSSFSYLAVESGAEALELAQPGQTAPIPLLSPGVGVLVASAAPGRILSIGDTVRLGQVVLRLKRFKSCIDVIAPCEGEVESIAAPVGAFIEYGAKIAFIRPFR